MGWVMGACRQSMSEQKKCLTCEHTRSVVVSWVVWVVGMGGCDVKLTISHLARTHEPRAAGRLGLVHKGGPNPSTAGSIPSLLGRTGNPQALHEGADVAGGGMGWNGWKTESWLPTSARTAWSRIRNGSRRGMAGAGYARDMAWGAACGAGWGPFYLRARQVRWQKQLTLVELTLDTFLMCTCKGRQLSWLPGRPLP